MQFLKIFVHILSLSAVPFISATTQCDSPVFGPSTSGLLDAVSNFQNTIGYAGLDSVIERKSLEQEGDGCTLKVAKLKNKFGTIVEPTSDGAQASVRSKAEALAVSTCPGFGLCADIYDADASDVWPISTLTYIIVPTNTSNALEGCDKMKTVYDYVHWTLTDSAAVDIAKKHSFSAMPIIVANQAVQQLDLMKCTENGGVSDVKIRTTWSDTAKGAGSSLQGVLQTRLTDEYFNKVSISISYTTSSSGKGRAALKNYEADFSGSDSILDMEDPDFIMRKMKMIPAFAAPVAIIYNLAEADGLVLTREALNKMFTAEVTSWADPEIANNQPDGKGDLLPNEAILRVVRESKSGTTSAFTQALYAFAGFPTASGSIDFDLHVLGGSNLPEWPSLTTLGGATCVYKACLKSICEPGFFLDVVAEKCDQCPLGTFSNVRGQHESCQPCPAGSYTNTLGNTKCGTCDDTEYQDEAGQINCKRCPSNTRRVFLREEVTVADQTAIVERETPGVSVDECKCVTGYWLPEAVDNVTMGGLECKQCPEGATCGGFVDNVQQIPQPKRDFWGDPANPHTFIECVSGHCLKEYACADGHSGRLCAEIVENYFTVGELWFFQCPDAGTKELMTILLLCCVVGVWVTVHHFSLKYDAFNIALLFFQIVGIISKFRLRWHGNLKYVQIALRIINFDVDFIGPQCMIAGWNPSTVYFIQLILPFLIVAVYSVQYFCLQRMRKIRNHSSASAKQIENKSYLRSPAHLPDNMGTYLYLKGVSYLLMMFHTITFRAFSVFLCETEPDGETQYMTFAPVLECWKGVHIGMIVLSILYIPTIIIGVPMFLLIQMIKGHRDGKLVEFSFTETYWPIFAKYKVQYPWWEMILLSRRVLITLVLVFVPVSMLQAALAIAFLNIYLFLHLSRKPFRDDRVGLLESFGLFCSMAFAVCGMLFYPSLDSSLRCVGSENLSDPTCSHNKSLKAEVSIVLLLLLFCTMMCTLYITVKDIREKLFSAAAAKKIESDRKWYGKDKLLRAAGTRQRDRTGSVISAIVQSQGADDALGQEARPDALANLLSGIQQNITSGDETFLSFFRQTMNKIVGIRETTSSSDSEEREFANPYCLNLCDMLGGDYLQNWHKTLSTLSEKELAIRLMYSEENHSQSIDQELAYMDLEMWVPAFARRHEEINGFYSTDQLATILRTLGDEVPGLVDWMTNEDYDIVQRFSNFVYSFTVFVKSARNRTTIHNIILPEHRAQVMHWLMQCNEEERQMFSSLFCAMAKTELPKQHTLMKKVIKGLAGGAKVLGGDKQKETSSGPNGANSSISLVKTITIGNSRSNSNDSSA